MHEQKFKDLLSNKCQVSVERIVLDLESEAMRGPGSIPTGGNILSMNFLGGLSLHLNHLIGSRMTNYNWPFGTLPLGFFGSNSDTRDLETYPRTYSGHF